MKNINLKSVGITLLVVSILLFGFCFTQTKVNINRLSPADIIYACDNIKGLGDVTAQELIKNTPMANLDTVTNLPAIGEKKAKIINQHFTTIDTIRSGIFIGCLFAAIALNVAGSTLITCYYERIKREEERFDRAFFNGKRG